MWMRLLHKATFPVTLAPFSELDLSNLAQKAARRNTCTDVSQPGLMCHIRYRFVAAGIDLSHPG
jgi:hypothetical protein